jgi:hypothetical protein
MGDIWKRLTLFAGLAISGLIQNLQLKKEREIRFASTREIIRRIHGG